MPKACVTAFAWTRLKMDF